MRISDWSSDVCSSDLERGEIAFGGEVFQRRQGAGGLDSDRIDRRSLPTGTGNLRFGDRGIRGMGGLIGSCSITLPHRLLAARPAGEEAVVSGAHPSPSEMREPRTPVARTSGSVRSRLRLVKGRSTWWASTKAARRAGRSEE